MAKRIFRRGIDPDEFAVRANTLFLSCLELCNVWDDAYPPMKKALHTALIDMAHQINALILEYGCYGKNRGERRDTFRAKVMFITGEELDHTIRCIGWTKANLRCRNRPYVGEEHCHVHATATEKRRAAKTSKEWQAHVNELLREANLHEVNEKIWDRIQKSQEIS